MANMGDLFTYRFLEFMMANFDVNKLVIVISRNSDYVSSGIVP